MLNLKLNIMEDYGLECWNIHNRVELVKKLNSSLAKLENVLHMELPKAYLKGNKVVLHIMYFKNFIAKINENKSNQN